MASTNRPRSGLFTGFTKDLDGLIRGTFPSGPGEMAREGVWSPPTDVYDADDAVVVRMEIPGVRLDEMDVTIVENRLVIRGKRREDKTACRTCYRQVEILSGTFLRVIPLPVPFDRDGIVASYRDGFLYVEVPRIAEEPEERKAIRIDVKPGGES